MIENKRVGTSRFELKCILKKMNKNFLLQSETNNGRLSVFLGNLFSQNSMKIALRNVLFFVLIFCTLLSQAQKGGEKPKNYCEISENQIVIYIDNRSTYLELRNFLAEMDLSALNVDSLFLKSDFVEVQNERWQIQQVNNHLISLTKSLDSKENVSPNENSISQAKNKYFFSLENQALNFAPPADNRSVFGNNEFQSEPSVFQVNDSITRFILKNYHKAKTVYLAGTFNNWSSMASPMKKTDEGWIIDVKLAAGKHLYKFVADGYWLTDPNNKLREFDFRISNSVYFKYNYIFRLNAYEKAKNVELAASFNNWTHGKKNSLKMQKNGLAWELPIYLKEGTYTYKFVVDGKWITDPENPYSRADGHDGMNSVIALGDTSVFVFTSDIPHQRVTVAGDFNYWNFDELVMTKNGNRWELPYVLASGNYQYKFMADNQYFTDANNPHYCGRDELVNSVISVKPNHTFFLDGHLDANEVLVSGTFNQWSHDCYQLKKEEKGWSISLHLPSGKNLYKFIVDGVWIEDPQNKYWEPNEFDEKNSVLWINSRQ